MLITNELFLNPGVLEDVQILVVDNDRDDTSLYTLLLEAQGAKVTACESIQAALDLLDWYIPHLVICELRFLGESVKPLIHRARSLAFNSGRTIPILGISTCAPTNVAQQFEVTIEAYSLKPIDVDTFADQVCELVLLSNTVYPPTIQAWMTEQDIGKTCCCAAEMNWIQASSPPLNFGIFLLGLRT